jgi:hypothetical protein
MDTPPPYTNYDFTDKDVYCFSDLEGYMPPGLVKTVFGSGNTFESLYEDMVLRGKLPDMTGKAIVYTGDLIDRGECSIRMMHFFHTRDGFFNIFC